MEASVLDIQEKIDEMIEFGGLSADLKELEKKVAELKRLKSMLERNITDLQRQQKRIEFETRNITAKNTRLTGRRKIQSVYIPGAKGGQQHQFMVLAGTHAKEQPDFTLMGAKQKKPERPGSNTSLVPPIESVRTETRLSLCRETEEEDVFPICETPLRDNTEILIEGPNSVRRTSVKSATPKPGSRGGFLPFFCIVCRKQITSGASETPCILHPQLARNREYMCCKAKVSTPGCCTVQHCFIIKDESNSNIYMKTSNGKYSMTINFTSSR